VKVKGEEEECTNDGTVDFYGMPANRAKTGKWLAGIMLLCKFFFFTHKKNIIFPWKRQKRRRKRTDITMYLSFLFYTV